MRRLLVICGVLFSSILTAQTSDLIISEYLEGSSNDKCIEIYNGTAAAVNLSGYTLERYTNGSTSSTTITLPNVTLNACDVFVVCNSSSQAALLAIADMTTGSMTHNGDDAIALFNGGTMIDLIGDIGCDPGSEWTGVGNGTADNGLIRQSGYCTGVTTDPTGPCNSSSWTTFTSSNWASTNSTSDFSDLGSHTSSCGCGASNTITTTGVTGNPWTVDCNTTDAGTVTFTSTGTFNAANVYSAELSDATGSFVSPTVIGTLASTANSGTINITIPAATGAGTAYRIRVVADDPATTGTDNGTDLTINGSVVTGTVIMNEMSNGASGSQEYMEMLVVGAVCTAVNIQNVIFDDNNGDFGAGGVASGHSRFTDDPQWGCIPTGTLIVVYNNGDPNGSLPADDETDANGDSVYVLPVTSTLLEQCTTSPSTGNAAYDVTGCTYGTAGSWNALGMANSGDAAQTRNSAGTFMHGIGYGGSTAPGGGVDFGASGGAGDAFIFDNAVNDDYTNSSNFSFGAVASFESPGAANSTENATYINSFRCPLLPISMLSFDATLVDEQVFVKWSTSDESNSSHYEIQRSQNGVAFEIIGYVTAAGYSQSILNYNFLDDSPLMGLSYYRLKQFDMDGYSSITGVRSVYRSSETSGGLDLHIHQLSPNQIQITTNGFEIGTSIELYSITGKLIYSSIYNTSSFTVDLPALSNGFYVIRAQNGTQEKSLKFLVR